MAQPLAETHQLSKNGKASEEILFKAFLENNIFVPSRKNPAKGEIEPATSEIDDVTYVLAFDSPITAMKKLGKQQLKKTFMPPLLGDKFALIVKEGLGIAVGTRLGEFFTISPDMLKDYRAEQGVNQESTE